MMAAVSQAPDPHDPVVPGAPADPLIGLTIGNYQITAKIGAGGMGAVYLALHPGIGRKVAVKVLLPEHSKRQDLITRFFNEAKATATLRHPALIEVFDFGFLADGAGYLVMDFLEGESLSARLGRVAPLPPELAAEIGRQLAAGVAAAHAHGIVHRDLKPDNIFLVPDPELPAGERVKILDFGIAKLILPGSSGSKGATSTGMLIGTPLYMAPEQCRGAGLVDHRADVYSAGCILYEMLAGRPPFNYEGVGEILAAHLHQAPTPLHEIDPSIPEPLEAIVMTALQKDPAARQQTMADLSAQLQQFLRATPAGHALAPHASGADSRPGASASVPGAAAASAVPMPSWSRAASGAGAPPDLRAGASAARPAASVANRASSIGTAPTTFSAAASQAAARPESPAPAPAVRSRAPLVLAALVLIGVGSAGGLLWLRTRASESAPASAPAAIAAGPATGKRAADPVATPPPPALPAPIRDPAVAKIEGSPAPIAPAPGTLAAPDANGTTESAAPAAGNAENPAAAVADEAKANPANSPPDKSPSAATKPAARSPGRARALYEQAFDHRAAGEEDKALLAYRAALRAEGLSASERADAETQVINLSRKYGEIEVLSPGVAGAVISIDGRIIGRTPLRDPILVRPGSHEITLQLPGYQPRRDRRSVAAGKKEVISLKLAR
jgi:hypothetical protein